MRLIVYAFKINHQRCKPWAMKIQFTAMALPIIYYAGNFFPSFAFFLRIRNSMNIERTYGCWCSQHWLCSRESPSTVLNHPTSYQICYLVKNAFYSYYSPLSIKVYLFSFPHSLRVVCVCLAAKPFTKAPLLCSRVPSYHKLLKWLQVAAFFIAHFLKNVL